MYHRLYQRKGISFPPPYGSAVAKRVSIARFPMFGCYSPPSPTIRSATIRYCKTGPKRRRKTRRDGNEKVRKGLGCTNRSLRMDWFSPGQGKDSKYHPGGNKILRQQPVQQDSYIPATIDYQPYSS